MKVSKSQLKKKSVSVKTTTGKLTLGREPSELLTKVLQGKQIPKRLTKNLSKVQTIEMNPEQLIDVLY
jgi:hypothetical protein